MFISIQQRELHIWSVTIVVVHEFLELPPSLVVVLITCKCWLCTFLTDSLSSPFRLDCAATLTACFVCAMQQICACSCCLLHANAMFDADCHLALAGPTIAWKIRLAPFTASAHLFWLICAQPSLLCQHTLVGLVDCFTLCAIV